MRHIARLVKRDDGMATAEYAVGTVAAAGLGGILIKLLSSTEVRDFLWNIISSGIGSLFSWFS